MGAGLRVAFGLLGDALVNAATWLLERPMRMLCFVLFLICAFLMQRADDAIQLAEYRKEQAAQWEGKFRAQKAEMLKFKAQVEQARVQAAERDRENIARFQREWSGQLQEVISDYQADLAAARAAAARGMRPVGGSGADGVAGGGGPAAMSGLSALPGGTVRAGESAIVDAGDIDVCTVGTVRLEHLIAAWRRAEKIDVNGER